MLIKDVLNHIKMPVIYQDHWINIYKDTGRYYHNLDHIQDMLTLLSDSHNEIEIILDAILFHDIIISTIPTPRGMDEALSTIEYISYTTRLFGVSPYGEGSWTYERKVCEAIIATSRHDEDQEHLYTTSQIVLDLDLAFLAFDYEEYLIRKEKLEKEYMLFYKKSFNEFLKSLLKRNKIYYLHPEWEILARKNISLDLNLTRQNIFC